MSIILQHAQLKAKQRSTHGLWPILNAHKMKTSHSTIKCPMVLFEDALRNSTLKRDPKLKVSRTLRVHQTLLTTQNRSLKCYF